MVHSRRFAVLCLTLAVGVVAVVGVSGCSSAATDPATTRSTGTTETGGVDPGKALVDSKCSMCHTTDRVYAANKTRDEWVTTLERMKSNGLVVTETEYDQILDFLVSK